MRPPRRGPDAQPNARPRSTARTPAAGRCSPSLSTRRATKAGCLSRVRRPPRASTARPLGPIARSLRLCSATAAPPPPSNRRPNARQTQLKRPTCTRAGPATVMLKEYQAASTSLAANEALVQGRLLGPPPERKWQVGGRAGGRAVAAWGAAPHSRARPPRHVPRAITTHPTKQTRAGRRRGRVTRPPHRAAAGLAAGAAERRGLRDHRGQRGRWGDGGGVPFVQDAAAGGGWRRLALGYGGMGGSWRA